jgi:hypothetical protein
MEKWKFFTLPGLELPPWTGEELNILPHEVIIYNYHTIINISICLIAESGALNNKHCFICVLNNHLLTKWFSTVTKRAYFCIPTDRWQIIHKKLLIFIKECFIKIFNFILSCHKFLACAYSSYFQFIPQLLQPELHSGSTSSCFVQEESLGQRLCLTADIASYQWYSASSHGSPLSFSWVSLMVYFLNEETKI